METIKKYTLYVGLNDNITRTQKIDTTQAINYISRYLLDNTDGGTITTGTGIYRHEDGTPTRETTIIIELMFIEFDAVLEMIKNFKAYFNQETIAIQETTINGALI